MQPVVLEENKVIEIEAEGGIEVVSAQGTELKKKVTTKVPVEFKIETEGGAVEGEKVMEVVSG